MNKLAHFVYELINGNETNCIDLSESDKVVIQKLLPIINRDPDKLAMQLSMPQVQAEEWLVPPPTPSID